MVEREFSITLPVGHFRAFMKRPRLARAALGPVVSFSSSAFCDNTGIDSLPRHIRTSVCTVPAYIYASTDSLPTAASHQTVWT